LRSITGEYVQKTTPGKRPASVTPKKILAMSKPLKSFTKPIKVICSCVNKIHHAAVSVSILTTIPQATMMEGSQIEGLNFFNNMLLGTSKAQYVKKKADISQKSVIDLHK
jgi:hypothetical protein